MNIHNPVDRSQCSTHCNSTITDIPQVERERILPRTHSTPSQTGRIKVKGHGASGYIVRFIYNWASKASPTLGCSIEISRNMYIAYYTSKSGMWLVIS